MAPKKKIDPVAGQRSIAAFFSSKPKKPEPAVLPSEPAPAPAAEPPKPTPDNSNTAAPSPLPSPPQPAAAPVAVQPENKDGVEKEDPAAIIGRGISVYWKDDEKFYEGRVARYNATDRKYLVEYDDGDEEWVDLAVEKYNLLDVFKPARKKKTAAAAAKRKRTAAVIESSDDEDAASGSEYEGEEDAMSEDESLDLEESSDDDDEEESEMALDSEDDDAGVKPKKARATAASHKKSSNNNNKKTPAPAKKAEKEATHQATPGVALKTGFNITPTTETGTGTAGKKKAGHLTSIIPRPTAGHVPASAAALRSALDKSPFSGGGGSPGGALVDAAVSVDVSRFAARDAARFPFLHPDKIRDAAKRRPDDPNYDPTTLHIPPDWFKQNKVSEGQRQWWEFKAANWGAVLLFKMGKFYELFEMDAHVGAECLGLSYMKGDQPHCGFPEAGYSAMAERLARAGHRVVVIEQTETPDALAKRNEERKRQGLKKDNVVRREKVAVLTKGTLTDGEMMGSVPDAQYLMSVIDLPLPESEMGGEGNEVVWIGAAAVDVATGQILIGQWKDGELRSQLRAAMTALSPVELVLPRGMLSGPSRRVVLGVLRSPLVNELTVGNDNKQFWTAEGTWHRLLEAELEKGAFDEQETSQIGYFKDGKVPQVLEKMAEDKSGNTAAIAALGGCISYLKSSFLDKRVLSAGRVEALEEVVGVGESVNCQKKELAPMYMALDGPALENLEILENSEGGVAGTLLAALDHCTTPFGRRRLRQWLCRPLCRAQDIIARQDAVQDLMGPAEEAAGMARKALAGVSDLERSLARIGATGGGVGSARDAPRVILYEDVSKKRVHAFVGALKALEKVQDAISSFENCGATSKLLLELITPGEGRFPEMKGALEEMNNAADWSEAEASGRVVPKPGVDEEYDAAEEAVKSSEDALSDYLKEIKAELGSKNVKYASLNKESHVIEVPEDLTVPREWESMQGKKGVRRYTNSELKELVATREAALDAKEKAQGGILRAILRRFAEKSEIWTAAVECIAVLDVLMSLAVAAACAAGTMTRPKIVPWSNDDSAPAPIFKAKGLRHPAGVGGAGGSFVPNNVQLGGDSAPFVVLTGPNMGGKSTLMRQICLASVAAQIGAWVPADSLELTATDAVFVRMGARDRIMLGQSTFFVELSETAAALASATRYSLVALDELGRGTATTDGAAIAASVLDHFAGSVKCRGVFATHYHHISDSHAADPSVAIKHMACAVIPAEEAGGVDQVTFLYRLTDGACPKSYGVNVARLAGLPESVVVRAAKASQQAEDRGIAGLKDAPLGTDIMEIDESGGNNEEIELEKLRERLVKAWRDGEKDSIEIAVSVWKEARGLLL